MIAQRDAHIYKILSQVPLPLAQPGRVGHGPCRYPASCLLHPRDEKSARRAPPLYEERKVGKRVTVHIQRGLWYGICFMGVEALCAGR